MTKLAEKPGYCVSCYSQPDGDYVDFEAAYDGPVIPGTPEPMPVEDLVICKGCLEEAFALLDPDGQQGEIEKLTNEVRHLSKEVTAKDRLITGLQNAVNELAEHPVKKPAGRPAATGISAAAQAELTKRRKRGPLGKRKTKKGKDGLTDRQRAEREKVA